MDWALLGYDGASALKLGMTREQAGSVVGPPSDFHISKQSGRLLEYRFETEPDLTYDKGTLVEISFTPRVAGRVTWNDIAVFDVPKSMVLKCMTDIENEFYTTFGMLIAYDLGLFLHGFHSDQDDLRIGLFQKGYFDYMLHDKDIVRFTESNIP